MTNPLIEQKVKELAESLPIAVRWSHGALEDPYHSLIRQALLSLYNQGRLDALGQLESVLSGYEGNRAIIRAGILSHIASLKEPLINI